MPLLHSEAQAALLEAGALSHRLAERYAQAARQMAEHADADDQPASAQALREHFGRYADALAQQADQLDDSARAQDLLPREPHTELETLKQLADHIQTLLDDRQGAALAKRFMEEEETLLQELKQAADLEPCPDSVSAGIAGGRERLDELAKYG